MSIEKAVKTALSNASIRAMPASATIQNPTLPYVIYRRISTMRNDTLSGEGSIENARIQFNCYAANYDAMKDLAESVKTAIGNYFGAKAVHAHESDETDGDENWVWIDYSIWMKK
jgi:hypothetical protein